MAFTLAADWRPGTPGNVCYLCRAALRVAIDGTRERVVDPHVHIDWEGPLSFCESCVTEMGRLVGMVDPTEIRAARAVTACAEAAADQATAERDDLRAALEALTRAGFRPSPPEADADAGDGEELECCGRTFGTTGALRLHQARAAAHQ